MFRLTWKNLCEWMKTYPVWSRMEYNYDWSTQLELNTSSAPRVKTNGANPWYQLEQIEIWLAVLPPGYFQTTPTVQNFLYTFWWCLLPKFNFCSLLYIPPRSNVNICLQPNYVCFSSISLDFSYGHTQVTQRSNGVQLMYLSWYTMHGYNLCTFPPIQSWKGNNL